MAMVPCKDGKPLVWDATCLDTMAPSYHEAVISQVQGVASSAQEVTKYSNLVPTDSFTPVAVEIIGSIGSRSMTLLKELGYCIRKTMGEVKALAYLLQHFLVAIPLFLAPSVETLTSFSLFSK